MKRSLWAMLLLAGVPALGGQTIPIETDLSGTAALELVSLADPGRKPASSKAAEAGFWRVVARVPGSAPAAFDLIPLVEPAVLPSLPNRPARGLEVRVTDATGRALGGAMIRIDPALSPSPSDSWVPAPIEALTGQDGTARLAVAPAVLLALTVKAPGFVAEQIEITPQMTREILVSLETGVVKVLEVRDGQGKPVPAVSAITTAGLLLGVTDKEGRLAVTVPRAGDLAIQLTAPDCRWLQANVRQDSPTVLKLNPPRVVKGQVVDRRTRQPIAAAWVWPEGYPSCSARSDKEGRYTVSLPGLNEPHVRGAAPGHQPESLAAGPGSLLLALAPTETRSAFGRVVDFQGRPVPGAEVLLEGRTNFKAATDQNGRFRIGKIGEGPFDLQARAPGFLTTRVRQVPVPPGPGDADLGVISLQAGTVLEGRVVDPEGGPVEGANVQADSFSAVTDGGGLFSLAGLREGTRLSLRVTRQGFAPRIVSGIEMPLPEPLTVELTPAARIAGTVLDETGDPVGEAKLILTEEHREGPPRGRFVGAAEVDPEGRFEMVDLTPGRFRLSALAPGFLPETRDGLELKAGEGIEGLDLTLRRGSVVEGRVLAPDGSPVAGARVLVLDPPDEKDLGLAGRPETFADNEGRYQLGGLTEGDRTVLAEHAGFRSARRQVKVQTGTTPLDLRLGRGFEVSGRVTGPEGPVAGANLRLLPQDGTESAPTVTSGADGTFRFEAVAEGGYRVETETKGYASAAREIRVAGSPLTGLEIRLERGGAIAGRILGLPFQDLAEVQVVATSPGRPGQAGSLDYQGSYRIEGLGPGEWKVIATQGSRQTGGVASVTGAPSDTRLDLEFAAGFTLSGRVERGGAPLGGALVLVEAADGGGGNAVTGPDGRFRVEGLRPGPYSLTALEPRSNLRSDQRLEIAGDREVVVALPVQN